MANGTDISFPEALLDRCCLLHNGAQRDSEIVMVGESLVRRAGETR